MKYSVKRSRTMNGQMSGGCSVKIQLRLSRLIESLVNGVIIINGGPTDCET